MYNVNKIKLKIKLKHLACEPKIIKREEHKALELARKYRNDDDARESGCLYNAYTFRQHRIFDVRRETRATHLAYGFMNGKKYSQIENSMPFNNRRSDQDEKGTVIQRVASMLLKYHRRHMIGLVGNTPRKSGQTFQDYEYVTKQRVVKYLQEIWLKDIEEKQDAA